MPPTMGPGSRLAESQIEQPQLVLRRHYASAATAPYAGDGVSYRTVYLPRKLGGGRVRMGSASSRGQPRWRYSIVTCAATGHKMLLHRSGDRWVAPYSGAPGLLWCLAKRQELAR